MGMKKLLLNFKKDLAEKNHRERHELLHESLMELVADYIDTFHGSTSDPIQELILWSKNQADAQALKGKYAFVPTSSEQFAARKQKEEENGD